jgi:acyl carrier protein
MKKVPDTNAGPQMHNLLNRFIRQEIHIQEELTPNDKLRIILSDSVQALHFVTTIEEEFDIEFDDDEIDLDFFLDINTIIDRIQRNVDRKTIQ